MTQNKQALIELRDALVKQLEAVEKELSEDFEFPEGFELSYPEVLTHWYLRLPDGDIECFTDPQYAWNYADKWKDADWSEEDSQLPPGYEIIQNGLKTYNWEHVDGEASSERVAYEVALGGAWKHYYLALRDRSLS